MAAAVRRGASLRAVARRFGVMLSTVWWVRHAGTRRLDRVNWSDRSRRPHRLRRTSRAVEDAVLALCEELRERSVLGEYGAPTIHRALRGRAPDSAPLATHHQPHPGPPGGGGSPDSI